MILCWVNYSGLSKRYEGTKLHPAFNMSESEQHRYLIKSMEIWLNENFPDCKTTIDIQEKPGDPIPQIINGHRPDLYAVLKRQQVVIGEAKTSFDIEHNHSFNQFEAFLAYLEKGKDNQLMLSVPYECLEKTQFVLEKLRDDMKLKRTRLMIFDECDAWFLEPKGKVKWHLF